jgi:hypothetical protein
MSEDALTAEDQALLDRLAAWVTERRLETPAVLFLESVRPMSFVGAQAMHFLEPFARAVFNAADYERLARLLERRSNLELLVRAIEQAADRREDEARARRAAEPKGRKADKR